jgi:hypothetical protein
MTAEQLLVVLVLALPLETPVALVNTTVPVVVVVEHNLYPAQVA